MYIYFDKLNAVVTCEYYPSIIPVDYMKEQKLEYLCNQWVKTTNKDNSFHLSFTYSGDLIDDSCTLEHDIVLYLQNSGHMDIVISGERCEEFNLCEDDEYPNVYRYVNTNREEYKFALHCDKHGTRDIYRLSDNNVASELKKDKDFIQYCHIQFMETL